MSGSGFDIHGVHTASNEYNANEYNANIKKFEKKIDNESASARLGKTQGPEVSKPLNKSTAEQKSKSGEAFGKAFGMPKILSAIHTSCSAVKKAFQSMKPENSKAEPQTKPNPGGSSKPLAEEFGFLFGGGSELSGVLKEPSRNQPNQVNKDKLEEEVKNNEKPVKEEDDLGETPTLGAEKPTTKEEINAKFARRPPPKKISDSDISGDLEPLSFSSDHLKSQERSESTDVEGKSSYLLEKAGKQLGGLADKIKSSFTSLSPAERVVIGNLKLSEEGNKVILNILEKGNSKGFSDLKPEEKGKILSFLIQNHSKKPEVLNLLLNPKTQIGASLQAYCKHTSVEENLNYMREYNNNKKGKISDKEFLKLTKDSINSGILNITSKNKTLINSDNQKEIKEGLKGVHDQVFTNYFKFEIGSKVLDFKEPEE